MIEGRFRYKDAPRLNLAFVRVERLSVPLAFPDLPKYGGCRSWVEIPELPAGTKLEPVLEESAHREREREIRGVLSERAAASAP